VAGQVFSARTSGKIFIFLFVIFYLGVLGYTGCDIEPGSGREQKRAKCITRPHKKLLHLSPWEESRHETTQGKNRQPCCEGNNLEGGDWLAARIGWAGFVILYSRLFSAFKPSPEKGHERVVYPRPQRPEVAGELAVSFFFRVVRRSTKPNTGGVGGTRMLNYAAGKRLWGGQAILMPPRRVEETELRARSGRGEKTRR